MCRRQSKRSLRYFRRNIYYCVCTDFFRQVSLPEFFHLHFCCIYVLCFNALSPSLDISKWSKRHFYELYPVKQRKDKLKICMKYLLIFWCTKNKIWFPEPTEMKPLEIWIQSWWPYKEQFRFDMIMKKFQLRQINILWVRNWVTSLTFFFFLKQYLIVILEITLFMGL